MSGYIDNSTSEALWSAYNGGRTAAGAEIPTVHHYAQWSSVMDGSTCDWCGWADERIFDTSINTFDPPMHWGCRCIIAHILRSEPKATLDWGDGPPPSSWPPGIKDGLVNGKPTLRNAGKNRKVLSNQKMVEHHTKVWERNFQHKMPKRGSDTYAYGMRRELEAWERQALRETVLEAGEHSVQAIDRAILRFDDFIRSWTGSSTTGRKKLGELMARGSIDDIQKLYGSSLGTTTREEVEVLMRVWEAHKDLAASTMRVSELSRDGKVTLYRGTQARRPSSKAFKESVEHGDLEQSIGADFIESWSTDYEAAKSFAGDYGMVFKKEVDVEDVFAHWQEHYAFGSYLEESEVIWYNWDGTLIPKSVKVGSGFRNPTIVEVF